MNKKEWFEEAQRVLREVANERSLRDGQLIATTKHSREFGDASSSTTTGKSTTSHVPDSTDGNELLNAHLIAASKRSRMVKSENRNATLSDSTAQSTTAHVSDSANVDGPTNMECSPKYEIYSETDEELHRIYSREWRRYEYEEWHYPDPNRRQPNPILPQKILGSYIGRQPGYTSDEILKLFANAHPELVARHAETGAVRMREQKVHHLRTFIRELQEKDKEQLKYCLTADDILKGYLFAREQTDKTLENKIRAFAKQNRKAVVPTTKLFLSGGRMRRRTVFAINKSSLQEFFNFAGLTVVDRPVLESPSRPTQPKIDPSAPGYKNDPTLQSLSDQEMDVIATRLAGKNITDADAADDALFKEIAQVIASRDDR